VIGKVQQVQQRVVIVDPDTAAIHFWSPGGVRRRPQRVASAAATAAAAAAKFAGECDSERILKIGQCLMKLCADYTRWLTFLPTLYM